MKEEISEIEYMHSYDAFPDDVIKAFGKLIAEQNLEAEVSGITGVSISNSACVLGCSMDRFDLYVEIVELNKRPKRTFALWELLDHISSNWRKEVDWELHKMEVGEERTKQELKWYAELVDKYLLHVIEGDFSWSEELFRKTSSDIKFIDYIYKNLEPDNEIRKFYEDNNGNWMPLLVKHLDELGIDKMKML